MKSLQLNQILIKIFSDIYLNIKIDLFNEKFAQIIFKIKYFSKNYFLTDLLQIQTLKKIFLKIDVIYVGIRSPPK